MLHALPGALIVLLYERYFLLLMRTLLQNHRNCFSLVCCDHCRKIRFSFFWRIRCQQEYGEMRKNFDTKNLHIEKENYNEKFLAIVIFSVNKET